jgi:hypothetical protein
MKNGFTLSQRLLPFSNFQQVSSLKDKVGAVQPSFYVCEFASAEIIKHDNFCFAFA